MMRTLVKVAGSIRSGASASRQRIELAEKHRMATLVRMSVRVVCRLDAVAMEASECSLQWFPRTSLSS